jgi:bifunctional DNA-binding transcriptional regulator/antitoxin component of YhaV-PrlF toxin-antitoxin module
MSDLRQKLEISQKRLQEINDFLLDPKNEIVNAVLDLVEKHGGPEAINQKAAKAREFSNLMTRLRESGSPYYKDVEWLIEQRDKGAFVTRAEHLKNLLGDKAPDAKLNKQNAVTLEISAMQYFPFLMAEAREAIDKKNLMPCRYIRVRNMKEQVADNADILAVAASMQVVGATYVETLDTKGTDGSNIHLGGAETITGYFGGVGQPNQHALQWAEEFLHYYTEYGIRQVLNVNPGTVLIGYMLHKLGIDNEFKISVYLGNDNPYACLWTLMGARLFSRDDGTTSLIGFNLANSVDNDTIRKTAIIRKALGLEKVVRIEHHIVETWKSIVVQPYDRLEELVEVAQDVPNISAKHEGGTPDVEKNMEHPSDILEYFLAKKDIEEQGLMPALELNYLEKHRSVNRTADALLKSGTDVVCAWNLHK